jgi:hypothetical protein
MRSAALCVFILLSCAATPGNFDLHLARIDGGMGGCGGSPEAAPPVHTVTACNALKPVGQWENITPSAVPLGGQPSATTGNGVVTVLTDPEHSGSVYIGTDQAGIWKTNDCGATWSLVDTGMNSQTLQSGTQWSMGIDPTNSQTLYTANFYASDSSMFKSTNGGADWVSLFPAGGLIAQTVPYSFMQEMSLDPTNPQHILISFHSNCTGAYAPMCLGETQDGGQNFRLFKGPIQDTAENARPIILTPTLWLYITWYEGVFYTEDGGTTWQKVAGMSGGNHQVYRAVNGNYCLGGNLSSVFQSADGKTWTPIAGSPNGDGLIGDGKRIFTGLRTAGSDQQPYFVASESDASTWTSLPSPPMPNGPVHLAYDPDHHLLYSANTGSGVWRMVTQ